VKPIFQMLTSGTDEGFACKELRDRSCDCPWHVHEEHELILVVRGGGYWMVGDHLAARRAGDLLLVGPNLPHVFRSDEHRPGRVTSNRVVLVQFKADFLGREFMDRAALAPVQRLLRRSGLGLAFGGEVRDEVAGLMQELVRLEGLRRLIQFLRILEILAQAHEVRALATPGFAGGGNPFDQGRMNRVCAFIEARLGETVFLGEAARMAHLSEGAFSRFFRAHTGKTFPAYVNELRVGRACRLLAEGDLSVTEVAFACGFENLSNFNRQFRRLKGLTPRDYRRQMVGAAGE
jgi:AraC-like DNA-binding protein